MFVSPAPYIESHRIASHLGVIQGLPAQEAAFGVVRPMRESPVGHEDSLRWADSVVKRIVGVGVGLVRVRVGSECSRFGLSSRMRAVALLERFLP